jgi:hypothetical protein
MADRMSKSGQSTWYWYRLDPADLAVEARTPEATGVSMVWTGGVDIDQLGQFFVTAVKTIFPDTLSPCRVWFATPDGHKHFEMPVERVVPVPPGLVTGASLVRFEWPHSAERKPALTVWSNRDENASRLEDLQQCLGIHVMPDHLLRLEDGISSIVTSMECRFFRRGAYSREAVLACLRQLRKELPEISIEGATP